MWPSAWPVVIVDLLFPGLRPSGPPDGRSPAQDHPSVSSVTVAGMEIRQVTNPASQRPVAHPAGRTEREAAAPRGHRLLPHPPRSRLPPECRPAPRRPAHHRHWHPNGPARRRNPPQQRSRPPPVRLHPHPARTPLPRTGPPAPARRHRHSRHGNRPLAARPARNAAAACVHRLHRSPLPAQNRPRMDPPGTQPAPGPHLHPPPASLKRPQTAHPPSTSAPCPNSLMPASSPAVHPRRPP